MPETGEEWEMIKKKRREELIESLRIGAGDMPNTPFEPNGERGHGG